MDNKNNDKQRLLQIIQDLNQSDSDQLDQTERLKNKRQILNDKDENGKKRYPPLDNQSSKAENPVDYVLIREFSNWVTQSRTPSLTQEQFQELVKHDLEVLRDIDENNAQDQNASLTQSQIYLTLLSIRHKKEVDFEKFLKLVDGADPEHKGLPTSITKDLLFVIAQQIVSDEISPAQKENCQQAACSLLKRDTSNQALTILINTDDNRLVREAQNKRQAEKAAILEVMPQTQLDGLKVQKWRAEAKQAVSHEEGARQSLQQDPGVVVGGIINNGNMKEEEKTAELDKLAQRYRWFSYDPAHKLGESIKHLKHLKDQHPQWHAKISRLLSKHFIKAIIEHPDQAEQNANEEITQALANDYQQELLSHLVRCGRPSSQPHKLILDKLIKADPKTAFMWAWETNARMQCLISNASSDFWNQLVNGEIIKDEHVDEMLAFKGHNHLMHQAAQVGNIELIANINTRNHGKFSKGYIALTDHNDNNILHWAAHNSQNSNYVISKIQELSQSKSYQPSITACNTSGDTPVHIAAACDNPQALTTFQQQYPHQYQKALYQKNNLGQTPLQVSQARINGNNEIVHLLHPRGSTRKAPANQTRYSQNSVILNNNSSLVNAMHGSAVNGIPNNIYHQGREVRSGIACIKRKDGQNNSILHCVAKSKNNTQATLDAIMDVLHEKGSFFQPQLTDTNNHGQNVLHIAAANDNFAALQGFHQHLPEQFFKAVDKVDKNGDTPLLIAAQQGNIKTVLQLYAYDNGSIQEWAKPEINQQDQANVSDHGLGQPLLSAGSNSETEQATTQNINKCKAIINRIDPQTVGQLTDEAFSQMQLIFKDNLPVTHITEHIDQLKKDTSVCP